MAKLADASGLGSDLSEVQVQVLSCAKGVRRSVDRSSSYGLEGQGFESFRACTQQSLDLVAEWLKALDCKSNDHIYVGSNPTQVKLTLLIIIN